MIQDLDERYYQSDIRLKSALIAVLQLVGLLLIPTAIVVGFYNHQLATLLFIVGLLLFWKVGGFAAAVLRKGMVFSGSKNIESTILYGSISTPDKAEKLEFMPPNIGGLYREGDEIVLGTLFGEHRCSLDNFSYTVKKKNLLIGYITLTIAEQVFTFEPNWDGPVDQTPQTPEKATWGSLVIDKITGKAEVLTEIETKYLAGSVEKNLTVQFNTDDTPIDFVEFVIREMEVCDYSDDKSTKPHIQAKVLIEYVDGDKEVDYDCDISYYGENGEFLGVDVDNLYHHNKSIGSVIPFSACLDIPSNTSKAVLSFTSERKNYRWNLILGISVITGVVVFGIWALKIVLGFFL